MPYACELKKLDKKPTGNEDFFTNTENETELSVEVPSTSFTERLDEEIEADTAELWAHLQAIISAALPGFYEFQQAGYNLWYLKEVDIEALKARVNTMQIPVLIQPQHKLLVQAANAFLDRFRLFRNVSHLHNNALEFINFHLTVNKAGWDEPQIRDYHQALKHGNRLSSYLSGTLDLMTLLNGTLAQQAPWETTRQANYDELLNELLPINADTHNNQYAAKTRGNLTGKQPDNIKFNAIVDSVTLDERISREALSSEIERLSARLLSGIIRTINYAEKPDETDKTSGIKRDIDFLCRVLQSVIHVVQCSGQQIQPETYQPLSQKEARTKQETVTHGLRKARSALGQKISGGIASIQTLSDKSNKSKHRVVHALSNSTSSDKNGDSHNINKAVFQVGIRLLDKIQQTTSDIHKAIQTSRPLQQAVSHYSELEEMLRDMSRNSILDGKLHAESSRWRQKAEASKEQLQQLLGTITTLSDESMKQIYLSELRGVLNSVTNPLASNYIIRDFDTQVKATVEGLSDIQKALGQALLCLSGHGQAGGKDLDKQTVSWLQQLKGIKDNLKTGITQATAQSINNFSRQGMLARWIADWYEVGKQDFLGRLSAEERAATEKHYDNVFYEVIQHYLPLLSKESDPQGERLLQRLHLEVDNAAQGTTLYPATMDDILAGMKSRQQEIRDWSERKLIRGAFLAASLGGFKLIPNLAAIPLRVVIKFATTGAKVAWASHKGRQGIRGGEGDVKDAIAEYAKERYKTVAIKIVLSLPPGLVTTVGVASIAWEVYEGGLKGAGKKIAKNIIGEAPWYALDVGGRTAVNAYITALVDDAVKEAEEQENDEQNKVKNKPPQGETLTRLGTKDELLRMADSSDTELQMLATELLKQRDIDTIPLWRTSLKSRSFYSLSERSIKLGADASDWEILHELAHALTAHKILYGLKAPQSEVGLYVVQLNALRQKASASYQGKDPQTLYYLNNINEFVAGLYSGNRDFINHLRTIDVEGKSIITRIVELIAQLLNVPTEWECALSKAMELSDSLISMELDSTEESVEGVLFAENAQESTISVNNGNSSKALREPITRIELYGMHDRPIGSVRWDTNERYLTVTISSVNPHTAYELMIYARVIVRDKGGAVKYDTIIYGENNKTGSKVLKLNNGDTVSVYHEEPPRSKLNSIRTSRKLNVFEVTNAGLQEMNISPKVESNWKEGIRRGTYNALSRAMIAYKEKIVKARRVLADLKEKGKPKRQPHGYTTQRNDKPFIDQMNRATDNLAVLESAYAKANNAMRRSALKWWSEVRGDQTKNTDNTIINNIINVPELITDDKKIELYHQSFRTDYNELVSHVIHAHVRGRPSKDVTNRHNIEFINRSILKVRHDINQVIAREYPDKKTPGYWFEYLSTNGETLYAKEPAGMIKFKTEKEEDIRVLEERITQLERVISLYGDKELSNLESGVPLRDFTKNGKVNSDNDKKTIGYNNNGSNALDFWLAQMWSGKHKKAPQIDNPIEGNIYLDALNSGKLLIYIGGKFWGIEETQFGYEIENSSGDSLRITWDDGRVSLDEPDKIDIYETYIHDMEMHMDDIDINTKNSTEEDLAIRRYFQGRGDALNEQGKVDVDNDLVGIVGTDIKVRLISLIKLNIPDNIKFIKPDNIDDDTWNHIISGKLYEEIKEDNNEMETNREAVSEFLNTTAEHLSKLKHPRTFFNEWITEHSGYSPNKILQVTIRTPIPDRYKSPRFKQKAEEFRRKHPDINKSFTVYEIVTGQAQKYLQQYRSTSKHIIWEQNNDIAKLSECRHRAFDAYKQHIKSYREKSEEIDIYFKIISKIKGDEKIDFNKILDGFENYLNESFYTETQLEVDFGLQVTNDILSISSMIIPFSSIKSIILFTVIDSGLSLAKASNSSTPEEKDAYEKEALNSFIFNFILSIPGINAKIPKLKMKLSRNKFINNSYTHNVYSNFNEWKERELSNIRSMMKLAPEDSSRSLNLGGKEFPLENFNETVNYSRTNIQNLKDKLNILRLRDGGSSKPIETGVKYQTPHELIGEGSIGRVYSLGEGIVEKYYRGNIDSGVGRNGIIKNVLVEANNNAKGMNRMYGRGSATVNTNSVDDSGNRTVTVRMKHIPGETLSEIIKRGDLKKMREIANLVKSRDVVNKLTEDLAKNGIVHNDINLGNIMYDSSTKTFYIIDFDSATFNNIGTRLNSGHENTTRTKLNQQFNELTRTLESKTGNTFSVSEEISSHVDPNTPILEGLRLGDENTYGVKMTQTGESYLKVNGKYIRVYPSTEDGAYVIQGLHGDVYIKWSETGFNITKVGNSDYPQKLIGEGNNDKVSTLGDDNVKIDDVSSKGIQQDTLGLYNTTKGYAKRT